ncbi:pyrroline-5-carboxylate reductase [bacterium]|nr:pyrroline-5-carboxylate reductase [bacterium]
MQNNVKTIAFIGAGNMAQSLIGGLLAEGYPADAIIASDPSDLGRTQVRALGELRVTDDNIAAVQSADVVILAVKPQVMSEVLAPIAATLVERSPLLISIAAGISCDAIQRWLGDASLSIVRCMPNTPALMRVGASGLYASKAVNEAQRELAEQLLRAVGVCCWIDSEEAIDAVTAISGSGPAYFFLFIELMQNIAIDMGLSPDTARDLSLQTAFGAATMALNSEVEVAELRRRVTSPNGTTEAAIQTFIEGDIQQLFERALGAAKERSISLAKELSPQ